MEHSRGEVILLSGITPDLNGTDKSGLHSQSFLFLLHNLFVYTGKSKYTSFETASNRNSIQIILCEQMIDKEKYVSKASLI